MARASYVILLVVVGAVFADDNSCSTLADCACGDVCKDGSCQAGCQVYDVFIREGRERTVYGRRCQCGVDVDADGRPILCAEGVTFENNPYQVPMFESNPACAAPPVIEEVPVEVLDASPAAAEATTAAAPEATTAAAK